MDMLTSYGHDKKSPILFFMILAWFSRFKNAVFLLFKVNTFSYEIACSIVQLTSIL